MPNEKHGGLPPKKDLHIEKLAKAVPTKIPVARHFVDTSKIPWKDPVNWQRFGLCCALIFFLSFLTYSIALFGNLVFNDHINVRVLTTANNDTAFWATWVMDAIAAPLSQPYARATHAWDLASFPDTPAWYHLVNIALHIVSCLYLFLLIFQLARVLKHEKRLQAEPCTLALLATLLFACHPLASGAVAYISGRAPLLMTCNYLLALNLFLLGFFSDTLSALVLFYGGFFIFTVIGFLSTPQAFSTPLTALALALVLRPRDFSWKEWFIYRSSDFALIVIFAVLGCAALLTKGASIVDNGVDLALLPAQAYVASQAKAFVTYFLRCLVFPAGLSIDPPWSLASGFTDPLSIVGVLVLLCTIYGVVKSTGKPILMLGLLLIVVGILPDFFRIRHEIVSDQRYYLSLAGASIVAGWYWHYLKLSGKAFVALTATLVLLLCGLTVWRCTAWLSDMSLWRSSLRLNKKSARTTAMLAQAYWAKGENRSAWNLADKALQLDKDLPVAYETLGLLNTNLRQFEQAVPPYEKAVEKAKQRFTAIDKTSTYQIELAEAYMQSNQWAKAKICALEAIRYRPGASRLYLVLGRAFLAENQPIMAYQYLRTGSHMDTTDPDFLEPIVDAGLASNVPALVQLAYQTAKTAMRVKLSSHANLAFCRAALELGRTEEALNRLRVILKREPLSAEANWLMAFIAKQVGEQTVAQKYETLALKLDPMIAKKAPIKLINTRTGKSTSQKPVATGEQRP